MAEFDHLDDAMFPYGSQDFEDEQWDDIAEELNESEAFGDPFDNCSMMADGQCLQAGSEDCDECPRMIHWLRTGEVGF